MSITVEVKREASESTASVLRRFSKKVQGLGVLRRAKSLRARTRRQSPFKVKKVALKRRERRALIERLRKLGKLPNATPPRLA